MNGKCRAVRCTVIVLCRFEQVVYVPIARPDSIRQHYVEQFLVDYQPAWLAQSVERETLRSVNLKVVGSTPTLG